MNTAQEKERMNVVGGFVLILLVALLVVSAGAQTAGTSIGQFCWRMLPFDDTIELDVVQFEIPTSDPGFFTFGGTWHGLTVYTLNGGGNAVYNPDAHAFALDVVLRNTSLFFNGQPVGRMTAITDDSLTGVWSAEFRGKTPPDHGGTPFLAQGTIVPMTCPGLGIPPTDPAVSRFHMPATGMLAGE